MKRRFDRNDFAIVSEEPVSRGFLTVHKLRLNHAVFPAGESAVLTREVMHRGEAAAILVHDPNNDTVIMIEQFRVGGINEPDGPWFIEIPAGMVDAGETPEQAAVREAREETGCEVANVEHIASYFPSPGGCSEKVHLFYGTTDLGHYSERVLGEEHEGENILVRAVPFRDAFAGVSAGVLKDAASVMALFWLGMKRKNMAV